MITLDAAAQLEALALTIAAASSSDPNLDAQYYALIAPAMLTIDGRTMAPGFRYTLNVTNALQGRAKHWFLILSELQPGGFTPCTASFELIVSGTLRGYAYSPGPTIGLATCAGICLTWAKTIRLWLAGNYPFAITPPPA